MKRCSSSLRPEGSRTITSRTGVSPQVNHQHTTRAEPFDPVTPSLELTATPGQPRLLSHLAR
ncbi:MAG TPA: hypothetical protein VFD01_09580 [Candidatus Dormibacteraeota bacterium]|nr:hypothetical protein [Candidatus Dormibacteraeota bacterium]